MKNILFLILLVLLFTSSCKKNNDDTITKQNITGMVYNQCTDSGFKTGEDDEEDKPIKAVVNSLNIQPNPNNGTFQLTLTKNQKPIGIKKIEVIDMMGRIVWQTGASVSNIFNIDILHCSQGIYYVRTINEDGELEMKKFVKE